jgi:predicted metalloenzyme YecM
MSDIPTSDPATLRATVPAFHRLQLERLARLGIDATGFPVSHVALRVPTWRGYLAARDRLERVATANLENVWNGRPISKIVLAEPIPVGAQQVDLVELIAPFHQRVYAMGLEHVGLVVGDLEAFVERHVEVLTGRQFQAPDFRPAYRLFPDYTHVKFYARSLRSQVEREGGSFTGFTHAEWHVDDDLAGPYELAG